MLALFLSPFLSQAFAGLYLSAQTELLAYRLPVPSLLNSEVALQSSLDKATNQSEAQAQHTAIFTTLSTAVNVYCWFECLAVLTEAGI